MLDSTARAERIEIPASEAAFYTWEVAQKPVAIRMPLAFIDRLESEAVENFRSLSSRGSEIGGVLLGSVAPGNPAVVSVSDFELLPCEYTRGPLYRLSDAEMARVEETIEKHRTASQRVVAFFRSHTRKGLSLDVDDLAFFEPRFSEPHQFVLLVRPFATKVSTAGIFIRENGKVALEASHKEFSFRSSELRGTVAPAEASESAPSLPSAAKPQPRAQIVPIASRREITLPEPVAAVPAPPPVMPEKVEAAAPAPAPAAPKPAEEKAAAPAPAIDLAAKPAEKPVEKPVEKPAEKAASQIKSAVEVAEPPAPAKSNKKLKMVVAAALGMMALVGGGLVVYPSLMKHQTRPPVAPQDSSPLSLRVERTSGGMLLTWNRDLPVIQSATKVVLSISDGDRHENIELDPNQVRTGSILYPPITGDVSFQMEVMDSHQSKTTSESLRVLDPRPSPLDTPAAAPGASTTAKDSTPAKSVPNSPSTTAAAPAADEPKPTEEAPKPAAAPLKHFDSSSLSLAQRLRPVSSNDLPEAPPVVRASQSGGLSLPGIITSQPAPPPPSAPKQPAAPAFATGGQLVPAKVISRIDPEYPKLAKQAGASGMVEMEATIGVDGKVRNPRVIHGNAMLQKAATDAVLQWRYKPAMLNGKPVESPVDIKLEFLVQR